MRIVNLGTSGMMFVALFFFGARPAVAETTELCGVKIEDPEEKIDFSKTETDWLCGKGNVAGWQNIPLNQKRFFLRSFLQSRGYQTPEFRREGDLLLVATGPRTRVKSFSVEGVPPSFDPSRRRRIVGQPLTPDILNEAEKWAKRELQQMGYPCPRVHAVSEVERGSVQVSAEPGPEYFFGKIPSAGAVDLPYEVIDRYTAFVAGQPFDVRLLELSSDRIVNAGLYLSTYYDILCDGPEPAIVRRFVPAVPRLLTIGVGFDTERGPLARARFQRVNIGHAADSFEATLLATFREQSAEARYHWHVFRNLTSPFHLVPLAAFERETEKQYQTATVRGGMLANMGWEKPSFQLQAEAGPTVEHVTTLRGVGLRHVSTAQTTLRISGVSHLFEYYATHPRNGWSMSLETSSRLAGFLSKVTTHRLLFRHEFLWNWRSFEPPALIVGWRGFWGSFTARRAETLLDIPPSERFFLGGDADIRGFGRKTIGETSSGLLSAVYQGIELRAGEWGIYPVQPLVFFDFAKGGDGGFSLSSSFYYAPGAGLRYVSPIGSVRATLGRGYIAHAQATDPDPGLQFFFSFGREF